MARVGVYVSGQTHDMTGGKFLFIAHLLQQAGHDVVVVTRVKEAVQGCQEKGVAVLVPRMVEGVVDVIAESKKLHALLDRRIEEGGPTWGALLALDDFIGGAQTWDIQGMEAWAPDVVVKANHGAESSTPEDEALELVMWRWAHANKVPTVALEVQCMGGPLIMTDYPHTVTVAQRVMQPAHRHYCRTGQDPTLEAFLAEEGALREKLQLPLGVPSILVPFHLYYMQECMEAFKALGEWIKKMDWKGKVFVPVGQAHRRMLRERDIVAEGCKRWWAGVGSIEIIEGLDLVTTALVVDEMLVPYQMVQARDLKERYGVSVVQGAWQLSVGGRWKRVEQAVEEALRIGRSGND